MYRYFQYILYFVTSIPVRLLLGANVKIVLDSYKLHRSAIIAVNHTSWLDPIVLVDHLPFRVFKQIIPIYFLAGERFFHKLWLRPLLSMSGAIPLKSEG